MKILVTGANGYLGQGVVKKLLDNGHCVIATDFATNHIDDRAKKLSANIFEIEEPYNYFDKPDIVLHMAWKDGFVHYSESHILDLPKHFEFLKKFVSTEIKKIVVMGSMHEIGFWEGKISEDTPCNPLSYYGISKNALRRMVEILVKDTNIKYQWLRGFYIVGNTPYGSSIFSKIVKAENERTKRISFYIWTKSI